jgi:hypothetical protein
MTRAEALVFQLLDTGLNPEEAAELEALLARPDASEELLALLRLEAALRSRRKNLALGPEVVKALQQPAVPGVADAEQLRQRVLEQIKNQSAPAISPVPAPARLWLRAGAVAGLITLVGLAVFWAQRSRDEITTAAPDLASFPQSAELPLQPGTTELPTHLTHSSWPAEALHRVWYMDLGTHTLKMATSPDGAHWSAPRQLTGILAWPKSLVVLHEFGQPSPFRLYYIANGEIHTAESEDGVNFHNNRTALTTRVSAEGLAVSVLTTPTSSYRLFYRDRQSGQIVYATSRNGREFVGVDALTLPPATESLSLRPAKFENPTNGLQKLWALDLRDHPHLLTSSNGYAWALAELPSAPPKTPEASPPDLGAPGEWSFHSAMNNWQQEGWVIFSNSGTLPDGSETAILQNPDGTVAVRDRRSWGNFYLTHDTAWTVPFTVELRVRLDEARGTDGDAEFPKFTVASLIRNQQTPGPQTWQPAFSRDRFGAWSLATGPWAACPSNTFQTYTIVCRFDEAARRALETNPNDPEAKVAVCVFDIYTNRNFSTPALSFHNMGFIGWQSVDLNGRLDIGFPWPSAGQITLDWVRSGSGVILDPQDPVAAAPQTLAATPRKSAPAVWQVSDSPSGPWTRIANVGEMAMLAPLGRPKYYRPLPN